MSKNFIRKNISQIGIYIFLTYLGASNGKQTPNMIYFFSFEKKAVTLLKLISYIG